MSLGMTVGYFYYHLESCWFELVRNHILLASVMFLESSAIPRIEPSLLAGHTDGLQASPDSPRAGLFQSYDAYVAFN